MHKEAAWLLRELPQLVERGVLDDAAAERLRVHYAAAASAPGFSWGMVLLAIGGALLVGLGVILIFAHNWEQWTPGVRVALSFLPLLAGQAACWRALRSGSRLWSEAGGVFTALAIGASIALIAQTYQFGGDLPRFVLTWTLLALPLVYLLDVSAVASLCWLGALGWALASEDSGWFSRSETLADALHLPAFLLLAALPLPHLLRHIRLNRASARVAWMLRTVLLTLGLGVLVAAEHNEDSLYFIYAGMAACAVLAGRRYFADLRGLWGNPLESTGRFGVYILVLLGTWAELWREVDSPQGSWLVLPAALGALALWLAWSSWRRGDRLLPPLFAALTPIAFLMSGVGADTAMVLFHLYAVALAAALIRSGLSESRLGLANEGVALIAALVLLRFFDSDLSYVVRGVGFIVCGAGFFAATLWLRRRVRSAA